MLDDLRPVLADIAGDLGNDRGAETLRWVHDQETTARGNELVELEHLRELVGDIESALTHIAVGPRGGKVHPATKLKMIADLLGGKA